MNSKYGILVCIVFTFSVLEQNEVYAWGWEAHRYINEKAVDFLPPDMDFFENYRVYLSQHSTDPDTDDLPGYYHYIDIDYYPEFFAGTLPHDWDEIVDLYGYSVVTGNGIIPWIIELWTDSLSVLMSTGQWETVWQLAAELGHYVADSHQPLHLTLNYNGQLTGNYGIHSRYETYMINPHLPLLPLPNSTSIYWSSIIDSVFQYIDELYPYVGEIIAADDLASNQDPTYGSRYYDVFWDELDSLTITAIHCAIIDLANIWHTAWINAGSPNLSLADEVSLPNAYSLYQNYPNPFNPTTTIKYDLPEQSDVQITIYDLLGRDVTILLSETQDAGYKSVQWDATNISSGMYFYQIRVYDPDEIRAGEFVQTKKMILLK